MERNKKVVCPNCGKELCLEKAGGWKTLSEVESIFSVTASMLIGLGTSAVMRAVNAYTAIFDLAPIHYMGAFLVATCVSFPFAVMWMVKSSKANLERLGIHVYYIECTCGNCYTIARKIHTLEDYDEDTTAISTELTETTN